MKGFTCPRLLYVLLALLMAGPSAQAQTGFAVSIPDPSALSLLGLGVAGLILGRYATRRKPGHRDRDHDPD